MTSPLKNKRCSTLTVTLTLNVYVRPPENIHQSSDSFWSLVDPHFCLAGITFLSKRVIKSFRILNDMYFSPGCDLRPTISQFRIQIMINHDQLNLFDIWNLKRASEGEGLLVFDNDS